MFRLIPKSPYRQWNPNHRAEKSFVGQPSALRLMLDERIGDDALIDYQLDRARRESRSNTTVRFSAPSTRLIRPFALALCSAETLILDCVGQRALVDSRLGLFFRQRRGRPGRPEGTRGKSGGLAWRQTSWRCRGMGADVCELRKNKRLTLAGHSRSKSKSMRAA